MSLVLKSCYTYRLKNGKGVSAIKTVSTWTGKMTCNDDDVGNGKYEAVEIVTNELMNIDFLTGSCDTQAVYRSTYAKDFGGGVQAHSVSKYGAY